MHRRALIVPKRIACKSRCLLTKSTNAFAVLIRQYSVDVVEDSEAKNLDFPAAYAPHIVEDGTNCTDYFKPPLKTNEKPFTLILPPPNITGTLHLGHALTVTVQDALVRWHRMRGVETHWIPGTDHAGIATQVVVEKLLWKERGQTRRQMGRRSFEEQVWRWKEEKSHSIGQQLRRLGAALDWDREMFTMDPLQSRAVTEAFVKLHEDGLIYRSDYLVNWSCVLQSAISDVEVEKLEISGPTRLPVPGYGNPVQFGVLTTFAYKVCDSEHEEIVVATTRPETMPGDVAVAVNPSDARYSAYVGRRLWHPFRKQSIPVVADEFVDPDYGTGAVKVTPAHDPTDFDVAKRHDLPVLQVIDESGNMRDDVVGFAGLSRFEARDAVCNELARLGLMRGTRDHATTIPLCGRSKDVIEYLVKPQWFVRCREMAERALEDVRGKRLIIEPSHFEKNWADWLDKKNIRDWCVSRQLWWGHRVPAYICRTKGSGKGDDGVWVAAENREVAAVKAKKRLGVTSEEDLDIRQDEDVLDTWFSSALLPFTAFGWPDSLDARRYPLSIMETGHDILFFWVARMVMLGSYLTGRLPFEKIFLHGVICDRQGRKMSKSLGNVISPENVIFGSTLKDLEESSRKNHASGLLSNEELSKALLGQKKMFPSGIPACGADALRFTLCSHNVKNHFISFDVDECNANRLFCNKMWQATKFTNRWVNHISELERPNVKEPVLSGEKSPQSAVDLWILSRLSVMVEIVSSALEKCDFHVATAAIKSFLYYEFCDVYLECTKRGLRSSDVGVALAHCSTLTYSLDVGLRALAPFMPHLAQYLHRRLPSFSGRVVEFPLAQELSCWKNDALEEEMRDALDIVVAIRRLKKIFGVSGKHGADVVLVSSSLTKHELCSAMQDLCGVASLTLSQEAPPADSQTIYDKVKGHSTIFMNLAPDALSKSLKYDSQKMEKKRAKLCDELVKMRKMTSSESYRLNADLKIQDGHAKKITSLEEELARIGLIQKFCPTPVR